MLLRTAMSFIIAGIGALSPGEFSRLSVHEQGACGCLNPYSEPTRVSSTACIRCTPGPCTLYGSTSCQGGGGMAGCSTSGLQFACVTQWGGNGCTVLAAGPCGSHATVPAGCTRVIDPSTGALARCDPKACVVPAVPVSCGTKCI